MDTLLQMVAVATSGYVCFDQKKATREITSDYGRRIIITKAVVVL